MRLPSLIVSALLAILALAGCGDEGRDVGEPDKAAKESGGAHNFDVERVATGFNRPVWVGGAPGDTAGLWVVEQPGRVFRLEGKARRLVLDLRRRVLTGAEQGLLGIAFHPDFASNGRVFLHFSDRKGDTNVEEYRYDRRRREIRERPVGRLLFVDQPEENHNGGQLAFGPDGRLYIGLGDGGGGYDPRRTAQDLEQKLGKLLSTDVDADPPAGGAGEREWRIELIGLRNPWRFSFDFSLGEIWIGDVGQDNVEEIDRVLLEPDEAPKNLGWSAYEGDDHLEGREVEGPGEIVWPVATYTHEEGGCSVTGGHVYRGTALPTLSRRYLYGDFCAGVLWSLALAPSTKAEDVRRERATVPQLTHIGEDAAQEVVFASANGSIYRAVRPARPR